MGKRKRNEGREVKDIHPEDWLESYSKVSRWLAKYDLVQQLEENGGLVKIPNFLPSNVAELALEIVEAIPADHWLDTAADRDYTQNNISHSFSSTKRGSEKLQSLLRLFILLLPDQLNAFSAARYGAKDHIEPHDDRAYVPVQLEERGEVITCSRDIAVIYYLTKDWSRDMGGVLVDCQTGKEYVPEFNSIVAFKVPRYHEVTAVTSRRPRLSIFGWFLQPGKLYELYTGEEKVAAERREIFREHGTTRVVANGVKAKGIAENGAGGRKRRSESNIEVEDRAAKDSGAALKQQVDGSSGNVPQCKLAQRIIANAAKQKKKKKR